MPQRSTTHKPQQVDRSPSKPLSKSTPRAGKLDAPGDAWGAPSRLAERAQRAPAQLGASDIVYLQRTIGNQAVARLLQRSNPDSALPPVQAKLQVGPANDRYEDEANRVAKSLSGASVQHPASTGGAALGAQRATDPQAPIGREGGAVDADTGQSIRRAQGGGRPIDATLRRPLEQTLDTDLSNARLHVNPQADDLNQRVGARAFTTGPDIFMQRSEYQPGSRAGRSLLYHELTHVHQQTGGGGRSPIRRSPRNDKQGHTGEIGVGAVQREMIQREVSEKSGNFSNLWGQIYEQGTPASQQAKQQSETYLTSFDTKPQDKQARKEQAQESKQLKQLLHFERKETKTTDSDQRIILRSILTAERARGQSFAVLAELKQFMLSAGGEVGNGDYIGLLNGKKGSIEYLVEVARKAGASPNLLNLFYSHSPQYLATLDQELNKLTPRVNKLAPEAVQIGSTSDKTALKRLPALAKQMLNTLASATQARQRDEFVQARDLVGQLKTLYETVWQLTTYGRMGAKSNLSSETELGEAKRLGGGEVGKVFEVNYDPTTNPSIEHGVFKQEMRDYITGDSPAAKASGIPENDSNFGSRSVSTYKVDKLLGLGMTPKTKFGSHKGMGGTVQDWAKGQSPQKLIGDAQTRYREFDYSDPEIQRQLATLQLFDAITGQVDRHAGNYYIYQGPGGTQITTIDNDLAFGANKGVDQMEDTIWKDGRKLANDMGRGVPLFVDESIAEQILDTTPQDLKNTISGMLSEAEVAKTLERFAKVKSELRRKKSNTERIKGMQYKLDVLTKYEGRFGSSYAGVEDAMSTQIDFLRKQLVKAYGQGALIDSSKWGELTAQHLNSENSYFGMLKTQVDLHKQHDRMIPVE